MDIRKAEEKDLGILMEIYAHARAFMRKTGNPGQWKDSYPAEALIREEIRRSVCYVCVQENEIEGVFSYLPGPDSTYQRIDGGKWLNEEPYGVIHRLAGRGRVRGVADCCLEWAVARCGNLRIDTHRDNRVMQHILGKNGFVSCGTIYVADGSPRIAYQKVQGKGATAVAEGCDPAERAVSKCREEYGK